MKNTVEGLTPRIEAALDDIRPYLEADNGDIRVVGVSDDLVVTLEFMGACGNCPMSPMTFKAGVEEAIKKAVPEIKSILITNLTPSV